MDTYISPKARGQHMNTTTTTTAAAAAAATIFDLFRASDVETLRYDISS